jgi:hypothetical protein
MDSSISEYELKILYEILDTDKSGLISFEEF